MSCNVAVVAVANPPLYCLDFKQIVFGRVAEEILEAETVCLSVARKPGGQLLAKKFAALFKYELELLHAGGSVDVEHDVVISRYPFELKHRPLDRRDTSA